MLLAGFGGIAGSPAPPSPLRPPPAPPTLRSPGGAKPSHELGCSGPGAPPSASLPLGAVAGAHGERVGGSGFALAPAPAVMFTRRRVTPLDCANQAPMLDPEGVDAFALVNERSAMVTGLSMFAIVRAVPLGGTMFVAPPVKFQLPSHDSPPYTPIGRGMPSGSG
ncbi:hypothetical protein LZC95_01215 [Pendulispora brunnea]|uniref:Uncharacterized protein n=1 Tax=Pendulispora brunnea TaxID=2905690 RepID=A0ABZ2K9Y7_9BACT